MSYKKLGDLVNVKGGKRLPKGSQLQTKANSHPYIRVRDMGERYIPRVGLEFVPDEVFPKISRYIVNKDDLIISIVGTIGLVSIIDEFFDGASQTENCAKLTGLDNLDVSFLYYYLKSEKGKQEILEGTVGAVQAKLPLYNIEKIEVYWPDRKERERVVELLSVIDEKSELNTETNQTLEQIAQAIFKSWFVDFDPVKAKMAVLEAGGTAEQAELAAMSAISAKDEAALEQLQAEKPDAYAELAKTAALFPSAMEASELGEIPEGWAPVRMDSLIELAYGKALKKSDRVEGEFPVYGSGGITGTHDTHLVEGPGIVVGRKGTVGSIYWEQKNFFPIDTVFYVKTKDGISLEYVYYLLQTLGLDAMNTDAAVPGLNRNNVYRLEVPGVSDKVLNRFTAVTRKISDRIASLTFENVSLTALRDTVLPKLLAGDLPITDTDEATS